MPDLKLNDSHDLSFVDGDFQITTTESESLAQRLLVKLYTFQGEWFLNTNLGVPYYQSILGKGRAKETIDNIFKQKILEEPEVIQVQTFESTLDTQNRIYSLTFQVKSENGIETIPVELNL